MSKKNEDILENIIAKLPGHIYWKNKDCVYLGCNDAQAKSLGFNSRHEIVGKTDFDLPWKEQASKIREADLRVINNAESITVEESAKLTDGTLAIFLSKKEPLRDENNSIIGILGVSVDITNIKEHQEKLKRANKSKSDFLRIMAHELTSPISNIMNSLDLVKTLIETDDYDKTSIFNYLELAHKEANALLPKLHDVINYINFDEKSIVSNKSACNLHELISKIIEINTANKSDTVAINFHIDENLPKRMLLDTKHLYLALKIIMENAIKYTAQGNININLEKLPEHDNKVEAMKIIIADSGPGIHAEQLKSILYDFSSNPFDETYKRYRKPSVRLPYAKLLIQHVMKGDMNIHSNLGEGTQIDITIPYETIKDENGKEIKSHAQAATSLVLLVEDNEITRHFAEEMLKKSGCIVDVAATGGEAINKAKEKRYGLIFLDITLPDMNGIQVFESIQQTICRDTPVVALTSHSSEEDIGNFISKGMLTVIVKPISFNALKTFIDGYKKSLEN